MYVFIFADLGSGDEKVKKVDVKKFLTPGYSTSGHVELYTVCKICVHVYKHHYDAIIIVYVCHNWLMGKNGFCLQVSVERGMSWEDATHVWADQNGPDDGFYVQVNKLLVPLYAPHFKVIEILNLTVFGFILRCGITRKLPSW